MQQVHLPYTQVVKFVYQRHHGYRNKLIQSRSDV